MPGQAERLSELPPRLEVVGRGEPLVELAGVTRRYGKRTVLDDVSLAVAPGELIFVTGPSGAGKTTLLDLIHGDLRPSKGRLQVAGFQLRRRTLGARLPSLRRRVGAVFQDHSLLPDLSARQNVAFALEVADLWIPHWEVLARAQSALEAVGLDGRAKARPHELSGGEQRRLEIARALVREPQVLVADEPTSGLDRPNAQVVFDLLEDLTRRGTAVIIATHDLWLIGNGSHRVVELREGRLVSDTRTRVAPRRGRS